MDLSQGKILQLTTPLDRFQAFDKQADDILLALDELGKAYTDLGFVEADLQGMTVHKKNQFHEELIQHGQLCLGLINHPLLIVLKQHREGIKEKNETVGLFQTPSGVWQHYKGTYYEMIGPCKSTDFHSDAVMYREFGNKEGEIYTITLLNFFSKKELKGQYVSRFTKIRD